MKIYTSYFGIAKKFNPLQFELISITRYPPKQFKGFNYIKLAPSAEILEAYKSSEPTEAIKQEYTEKYKRDILSKLDAAEVVKDLQRFSCGKDVVLLCYEKNDDFCHRHIVAEWLTENGYETTIYQF